MKNKMRGSMRTFVRILRFVAKEKWLLFLSLLFTAGTAALTLYFPVLTGRAVDTLADGHVDTDRLYDILIVMARVVLANTVLQWAVSLLNNRVTYRTLSGLRRAMFDKLWRLPLSYIEGHQAGELLSVAMADAEAVSEGLLLGLSQLFQGVLMILGTLIFMISLNVKVAVFVILITPLSLFTAAFIAGRTHAMFLDQAQARAKQTGFMEEIISNQKVAAAYCKEADLIGEFQTLNDRLQKCSCKATFFSSLTNPTTRFVNSMVYAGVCVFGAFSVLRGGLSVGELSAFLSYATQYTKPFNEISSVITELQNSIACADRIFRLLDEAEEANASKQLEDIDGSLRLEHLYFSYLPEKPLIEDLNLQVAAGKRIAIVGPTGCGKTTLINLLMRFYDPQQGKLYISGVDAETVSRESIRSNFGMVLQETWLKNASIRDNLLLAKEDATEAELIEAARKSRAYGFIRHLPDKLDTMISEDSLSAGQRQLLCIARIMLALPPMLILDEATSSIDTRMEMQIQTAFSYMMQGRTSFIVAHRLSTIRNADWILFMQDGKIVEQGTHEMLLAKKGRYSEMYLSQTALMQE